MEDRGWMTDDGKLDIMAWKIYNRVGKGVFWNDGDKLF